MRSQLRASVVAFSLVATCAAAHAQIPPDACQRLGKTSLAGATSVIAVRVEQGRFVPPAPAGGAPNAAFGDLDAFCRVVTKIQGTGTSEVTIEVWLPAGGWNQEFQPAGSSFWGGSIPYARMREILKTGAATAG